jgi:glycosyltransferase involved in cell wall biosynthesis
MKIAIDGTTLRARDGGAGAGIEHYTRMIASALLRVAPDRAFVVRPVGRAPFVSRHLGVPFRAVLGRADVLLCPSGHIPAGWRGRAAIVAHDYAIHEHPEWFSSAPSRRDVPSLRRAAVVFSVSEATRSQIVRLFPWAAEKTRVVYSGVDSFAAERRSEALGEDTVLCVGTVEPRKNFGAAARAFDLFLRAHPERAANTRLVVAGRKGWKAGPTFGEFARVNETWRDAAGRDVVRIAGYVGENEKRALYARASCLLMPSYDEGFGLPALEAMTAGVPVIASDRGALPEVCGDAALYAGPDDYPRLAALIAQCVLIPEAAAALSATGLDRAAAWPTWDDAARSILGTL